ncbi:hypothetical protein [Deefgea piscis]|uniref:hypothetical protein n=1 Tax=Deefgea piscis TaxID=2739061 RepID=UPI001C7E4E97|nr:hypothetical protein [Deefgea piscis]QZA82203.1 hypothetical protein K4H25_06050 [Deefgea piscis]
MDLRDYAGELAGIQGEKNAIQPILVNGAKIPLEIHEASACETHYVFFRKDVR